MTAAQPFVRRVTIRNYKSIAACDVELGMFTILVGRNGSGKSNFLDALRFVAESLQTSLDHAMKARGGINEVRRRSTGHPTSFRIELQLRLSDDQDATYEFEVTAQQRGGFLVKSERLQIRRPNGSEVGFRVSEGKKVDPINLGGRTNGGLLPSEGFPLPPAATDRLYLVAASGLPDFRPVYDALSTMGFYNLNPQAIRELQSPDPGDILHRDGGNLAGVIGRLTSEAPNEKERILEYLRVIVPEVSEIQRLPLGPSETLEFIQEVSGSKHPWRFHASNMSDGTLRALGVLVAVMQLNSGRNSMRFVGIEEPEIALHPAASGALMDALREGAEQTQVLVTTHSPDLLDRFDPEDTLLVCQSDRGTTTIDRPDDASVKLIKDHLLSAGELLRQDQLTPRSLIYAQPVLAFSEETKE